MTAIFEPGAIEIDGLQLGVADGLPTLAVAPRVMAELASAGSIEVTLPREVTPSAPHGGAAFTAERARRRRGVLRSAVITFDEQRLAAMPSPELLAARGLSAVRLRLGDGHLGVRGRAAAGGRQADFTARVTVTAASRRRVRVTIDDVRLYGFLPLAAPLVGGAL
ncbi:MAG TPA: hypothetical protein VHK47_04545, partial [Polyangia bacterium]|nr:hypothetical protein [Polyangia bacterium]